jgi:putative restriction endonuclease
VRLDVLQEIDGPMLQHGLQGFQGRRIHAPRADHLKPNRDFLAERYALFRRASGPSTGGYTFDPQPRSKPARN